MNFAVKGGMNEIWRYLGQGNEHEFALMQSRMRQRQKIRLDLFDAEKKEVEVDRSRHFKRFVTASEKVFDPQKPGQHLGRAHVADPDFGDHVQKVGVAIDADRLGFVDCGELIDDKARFQHPADSEQEVTGAVAEIRA